MPDEPAIDPALDERPLTLLQLAAKIRPAFPGSPTVHCVYMRLRRYVVRGNADGVFMEARKLGTFWTTSRAAWERFLAACDEEARKPVHERRAAVLKRERAEATAAERRAREEADAAKRRAADEALRAEARALGIL